MKFYDLFLKLFDINLYLKLYDLYEKEKAISKELMNDINWLREELRRLNDVLEYAAKTSASAKREFKDLDTHHFHIFDKVNDVIRRFLDEIRHFKEKERQSSDRSVAVRLASKSYHKLWQQYNFRGITKRLADIKKEMASIMDKADAFDRDTRSRQAPAGEDIRQEPANQDTVIGLTDVKEALQKQLESEEKDPRRIISICGMGGLGKTTLVHELYNSPDVTKRFPVRVWVSGSPSYDNVLSAFTRNIRISNGSEMPEEKQAEKLWVQNFLQEKRYLLVMDNIGYSDRYVLGQLWADFPDNNKGSRVIITTRNKAVAKRASRHRDFIHELRFMSEVESWELFQLKFGLLEMEGGTGNTRELITRCGGLPLAIIALAYLLIPITNPKSCMELSRHSLWNRLMKEDEKNISGLLWDPRNRELYHWIRPFFLYMAMFPEGYKFNLEKLISLWMAEDFTGDGQHTMKFIDDLVNLHLIQVAGTFWEETFKVQVHGLLRFLAVKEARELNFFAIFPNEGDGSVSIRHAIHSHFAEYVSSAHPDLRTLIIYLCSQEPDSVLNFLSRSGDLGSLLVLALKDINFGDRLPSIINKLGWTLRFLGLTNTSITEIPASIGNLVNLETLEAIGQEIILLPKEISRLQKLRHLRGKFYATEHIQDLTALQILCVLCVNSSINLDLSRLANLQELSVHFSYSSPETDTNTETDTDANTETDTDANTPNARSPPSYTLPRCANTLEKLWLDGPIRTIPNVEQFPQQLRSLILSNTGLTADPMPTLGRIPKLQTLELINSCTPDITSFTVDGFTKLEVLRLSNMATLRELRVQRGPMMPSLNGKRRDNCRVLNVPDRLRGVPDIKNSETEERIRQMHGNIDPNELRACGDAF